MRRVNYTPASAAPKSAPPWNNTESQTRKRNSRPQAGLNRYKRDPSDHRHAHPAQRSPPSLRPQRELHSSLHLIRRRINLKTTTTRSHTTFSHSIHRYSPPPIERTHRVLLPLHATRPPRPHPTLSQHPNAHDRPALTNRAPYLVRSRVGEPGTPPAQQRLRRFVGGVASVSQRRDAHGSAVHAAAHRVGDVPVGSARAYIGCPLDVPRFCTS
ncbi:hypothetical protein BV898_19901 [Hypsibius exemplaris]|uniref:Uncharacterized protein n=1 Tax=Hypsibius exemplaris TaxID=2072580 RepID=A0A9X6NKG5_HYPEX|nr:hypothetical protein BV898_19901 [Hypsibius exemplaris]